MLSVNDIIENRLDGNVIIHAYLYVVGGLKEAIFLSSEAQYNNECEIIRLPNGIIDMIIEKDNTFGVFVGGIYSYYAMESITEGKLAFMDDNPYLVRIDKLTLLEGKLSQEIIFSEFK